MMNVEKKKHDSENNYENFQRFNCSFQFDQTNSNLKIKKNLGTKKHFSGIKLKNKFENRLTIEDLTSNNQSRPIEPSYKKKWNLSKIKLKNDLKDFQQKKLKTRFNEFKCTFNFEKTRDLESESESIPKRFPILLAKKVPDKIKRYRKKGRIYKITNTRNGKIYVGQTIRLLKERWDDHLKDARRGDQRHICRAIRFYGPHCFKIELIETVERKDLDKREKYWIRYYNSKVDGYNMTEGGKDSFGYGEKNFMYKEVDKNEFKRLIKQGYKAHEIAEKLDISTNTVSRRTQQFWGLYLSEAREKFMTKEEKEKYKVRIKRENPIYIEIDENKLKALILKGYNSEEIADILKINQSTIFERTQEFWGLTLLEFRRSLTRPKLKSLIVKGLTDKKIAKRMNISIAKVYRLIEEFWGMNLIEARRKLNKSTIEKLIIQHKTARDIAKELNFSEDTIHHWVKKIWGRTFTQTWKMLIKPILKSLIARHLNSKQIARILNIDQSSVFHFTQEFWNLTLTQAWRKFMKPKLKSLIKEGLTAIEISKEINVDPSTVYKLTKEFWNVKFSDAKISI